jgi:hypothetical protein
MLRFWNKKQNTLEPLAQDHVTIRAVVLEQDDRNVLVMNA